MHDLRKGFESKINIYRIGLKIAICIICLQGELGKQVVNAVSITVVRRWAGSR